MACNNLINVTNVNADARGEYSACTTYFATSLVPCFHLDLDRGSAIKG